MANRYWIAGSSANWNDTANWSASSGGAGGAGVPGSGDTAILDGNGVGNCTCDVAINISSIDVQSGYSGTLDFADSAYAHAISGDATFAGTGTVDAGNATFTVGGNLGNRLQTTWVQGTGVWTLTGSSKTFDNDSSAKPFYSLIIDTGASYSGIGDRDFYCQYARIKGTLTLNSGCNLRANIANTNTGIILQVDSGGVLTGAGSFTCFNLSASENEILVDGTISITGGFSLLVRVGSSYYTIGGTGTISDLYVDYYSAVSPVPKTYLEGSLTCTGDVTFDCGASGDFEIVNSANPSWTFQGDLTLLESSTGTISWTKGTGTITLSGTANQAVDFNGESVEDIDIDKSSGTVTLTGNVSPDTLTITAGTLDIDGFNVTTTGNVTQAAGTTVQDTTGGGLITVGGNFAINGTSGFPCVWNGPDLTITGTATADYVTATNSDASGGTEVTATNSTDGTGNTNWNFGALLRACLIIGGGFLG